MSSLEGAAANAADRKGRPSHVSVAAAEVAMSLREKYAPVTLTLMGNGKVPMLVFTNTMVRMRT